MLDATDLLDPIGDVAPAMFPDDDSGALEDRLNEYLSRGYTHAADWTAVPATADGIAREWAYYLAFTAVAARLAAQPSTASLTGLGSVGVSVGQITFFQQRAAIALERYNSMITAGEEVTTVPVSAHMKTRNVW